MQDKRVKTTTSKHNQHGRDDSGTDERTFRKKYEKRCDKMLKAFMKNRTSRFSHSYQKLQSLVFGLQTEALKVKPQADVKSKQPAKHSEAESNDVASEIDRQIFFAQRRRLDFDEIRTDQDGSSKHHGRTNKSPSKTTIALKSCRFCLENKLISCNRIIFETDTFLLIVPDRCGLIR